MIALIRKVVVPKINLSTLSFEILQARQESCLAYAQTMSWYANHYKNLGSMEGMKYCAQRGIESIKEYQRICNYIDSLNKKLSTLKVAA